MDRLSYAAESQLRFTEAFDAQVARVMEIESLDLMTLRCHALLEVALADLLAARLLINSEDISNLNFDRLARISLAGFPDRVLSAVVGVNRIRNYVAHDLAAEDLEHRIKSFFETHPEFGAMWPPNDEPAARAWGMALLRLATAIAVIPTMLNDFRRGQREQPLQYAGISEPAFLGWIADTTVASLSTNP